MSLTSLQWRNLLESIEQKKCTPFIGAGASSNWLPLARHIADKWREEYGYPLDDYDLAKVAQFLAIQNEDELAPKEILSSELKKIKPPNFSLEENRNTPYAVLADLNLPIYITTNYDHFMEEVLRSRGKDPVSEFCRWNNYAQAAGIPSVFDNPNKYHPTEARPLVYHLHGDLVTPQSMVLTESDYIDFIVNLNSESAVLPSVIKQSLASTPLLFVGYSLLDINFRIIFRGIMNFIGSRFLSSNVAVMRPPKNLSDEKQERAKEYLKEYTKNMFKVNVYWGDASMFSEELRQRRNNFKSQS
jgi:hypothetical protein